MEHILIKNTGINKLVGSFLLAIICFFLFLGDMKEITKINSIVIPILIVFILYVGVKNLQVISVEQIGKNILIKEGFFWIFQSILYVSYNLILLIPVLINLKDFIKSEKQILSISVASSIIISIISICVFLLLINVDVKFSTLDMPVVYVIKKIFPKVSNLYGLIILIAIFTTAISVGSSLLNNIDTDKNKATKYAFFMCIISVIVSNLGFSNLVKFLFPALGYIGLLQILLIMK